MLTSLLITAYPVCFLIEPFLIGLPARDEPTRKRLGPPASITNFPTVRSYGGIILTECPLLSDDWFVPS